VHVRPEYLANSYFYIKDATLTLPDSLIPYLAISFSVIFFKQVCFDAIYLFSQGTFPCPAEEFFIQLLSDRSKFLEEYRADRKDSDLNVSKTYIMNIESHQKQYCIFINLFF
jgi:hypothetical protein